MKRDDSKGHELVDKLQPDDDDYFVIKPMHSGFYGTPLDILFSQLGTKKLILTGLAADICVLYTANDAYMRGFELVVLSDCVESNTKTEKSNALEHMEKRLRAQIVTSDQFSRLLRETRSVQHTTS